MSETPTAIPFWYDLPETRIAQRPVYPPESAKMLIVDRASQSLREGTFFDFPELVKAGDLLVYNDTAVMKSRLFGQLEPAMIEVEVLLVEKMGPVSWKAMGRPLRRFHVGRKIRFAHGLEARITERIDANYVALEFSSTSPVDIQATIDLVALMPIPPYIRGGRGDARDEVDYQTIFANRSGSIAAPTASLHFTPSLMEQIRKMGCHVVPVTLHVGVASFKAVYSGESTALTRPGIESFELAAAARQIIVDTKARGGRVIALGTTVARAIESDDLESDETGGFRETSLFITPGYPFKVVDALVTNFHQPGSTHLLLVQALMGRELLERSYVHALQSDFRFFSYGDGMVVV